MRHLAPVLFATVALGAAGAAWACSCVRYQSAEAQLQQADVAFEGTVVSTQRPRGPGGETATTFRVRDTLKGRVPQTVSVRHRTDSAACGLTFRPGSTPLVLAQRDPRGTFTTSSCAAPQFPEADFRRAAAPRPDPMARCNARRADFAVGQRYTPRLGERAQRAAGADTLRVIRPGQAVTRDFRADRLNLNLGPRDRVRSANCG